jgi:hypothetical protein
MTLEHQLGYFVGEYIFHTSLPTLSIDSLLSRKVIYVTIGEADKFKALQKVWFDNYKEGIKDDPRWIEMTNYHNELASKYLPDTLECLVPSLDLESINVDEFKQGIISALWNTDLCWYSLDHNDIEITKDRNWMWFHYKITFKLQLIKP